MSPSKQLHDSPALVAKLKVECAAWQALLDLLSEEEHALVDGEADRLGELNRSKLEQLQTLRKLAHARHDELLASGYTPDHGGMDAWLIQHGQPEQSILWQQLREMEHQTQAMNQRIGALIELRLSSTRQALNVLIHAATSQGGLYDESGFSVASRNGKPLTAA